LRFRSPTALLVILALINFLNYVDRYVVAAVAEALHKEMGFSNAQIGLLGTAFTLVHSIASVPLGYLADRWARKYLIAGGVALWSLATAAAGMAGSFKQMFVARAAVGIGEAAYAPAASALISDRFAPAMRARAMGIFQLGMVMGGAVGMIAGGLVAGRWGWRAAFYVVGLPGLLLAGLALLIVEPNLPVQRTGPRPSGSLRIPRDSRSSWSTAAWITLSGILITAFTGAIGYWALTYILRTRFGGDPHLVGKVALKFGPVALAAGIAGTLTGSAIADRLEKLRPGTGRLITVALGAFASAPCAAIAFLSSGWVIYLMLGLGVFFNVWYVGPILAALHDVVPPALRGTATGAYFFLIHFLGDGPSPTVVGWVNDHTGSLRAGLLGATGIMVLGGAVIFAAMPGSRRVAELKRAMGPE
jgi:MFS transporter, Spinster family, sphingosine-1-phosphate transporter